MSWNGMDFKRVWFDEKLHVESIDSALIYKKEEAPKMKTKMNEATIQALHKSIAHWNDICYGVEDDHFGNEGNCALCEKFSDCRGCPVDAADRNCNEGGAEWNIYHCADKNKTAGRKGYCTVDSADAAEAMLELLVSLLPVEESAVYTIYIRTAIGPKEGRGAWSVNSFDNEYTDTGITTDGRNAFPQAKYVWEKVFASHMYEWAECPTKWWYKGPHMSSWNHRMVGPVVAVDGKCVTCGQVVKKKVTKYKVVFRGKDTQQFFESKFFISDDHWLSVDAFNADHLATEAVAIIEETAKEFDV